MSTTTKRYAIASLWQETNTYAPNPTTLKDFHDFEFISGSEVGSHHKGVRSVIGGAIDSLQDQACFGLSAGAWPSGLITQETAVTLIEDFEHHLGKSGPVDGLVLNLHGAMVAEGTSDIEFEAVSAARRVIGDAPIVAVLDLHANPSAALLGAINGVTAYRTFPHVDMYERGLEAGIMLQGIVDRDAPAEVLFRKVPFITSPLSQGTKDDPMKQIIAATDEIGKEARSFVVPGFPYSDVDRAGMTLMVNATGESQEYSHETLNSLAAYVIERKALFKIAAVPVTIAVEKLKSCRKRTMLVDVGDNIGGGSDGTSTALLPLLLSVPERRSVFTFSNAQLVHEIEDLGVGNRIDLGFRNLRDIYESIPCEILSIGSGRYEAQGAWMGGRVFDMGVTATLRYRSIHVVITSIPVPPFHRDQLISQGLDPCAFEVLTAKGALAWQDAYGDLVQESIYVDSPGPTPAFPQDLPRLHATDAAAQPWEYLGGRDVAS